MGSKSNEATGQTKGASQARQCATILIVALQLGAPGVSLPVLDDGGLPLGLQVLGFPQGDADVFAVAGWIDDALRG